MSSGSVLMLSGILWEDNSTLRQRFTALGFEEISNRFLDEYTTVVFRAR